MSPSPGVHERETLTLPELARRLGISRSSVYQAAERGELPVRAIRIGRRIVIARRDVDELLGAGQALSEVGQ